MTDCCVSKTSDRDPPKRLRCPINGKEYGSVGYKTILHHLSEPWNNALIKQGYYFCSDADCEVVYFGQDNTLYIKVRASHECWGKGEISRADGLLLFWCFVRSSGT